MIGLKLTAIAILPVVASVLLYSMERQWKAVQNLSKGKKQVLYGCVFGLLAILGTECGVDIGGAILNVRDAAPICAGLIFGAPAGILAGLIGGIERWFCVYWGGSIYTREACSLATILAGVFAAAVRRWVFDDKKPSVFYGILTGVVVEVIHILLIFVAYQKNIAMAFALLQIGAPYMILLNGFSVMLAVKGVSVIGRPKKEIRQELKQISQTFQHWLGSVVMIAFLGTTLFSYILQTELSRSNAESVLQLNMMDVRQDIKEAIDEFVLLQAEGTALLVEKNWGDPQETLEESLKDYLLSEINIINEDGIIIASTYPDFVGYDMHNGEQSAAFLSLLESEEGMVQEYGPVSYDETIFRKYAGFPLEVGGFVQVGFNAADFQEVVEYTVKGLTRNRHIGTEGYIIIMDAEGKIVSDRRGKEGTIPDIKELGLDKENLEENIPFLANIHGTMSYCLYAKEEGYHVVCVLPQSEAFFQRDLSVYLTAFMEIAIFAVLFILIYLLIKWLIVDNIQKVNHSLAEITGGNLDVTVDVRTNEEFASLSDDINATVTTLKRYIAEAAARIDQELEYAKDIQRSALPSVFPPYPDRKEFSLYASMRAAKEVGGDFYDFFMLGENRLAFLIADVSGKGIPAAMFMMKAKTLIKSLAESGLPVDEIFTTANNELCANNDTGMFVTAWLGILDLQTGLVNVVNAGHNPPVLKRKDGMFAESPGNPGFVLGGLEDFPYQKTELQLMPGDQIYLYTDGVTEATDEAEQLYGEEHLLVTLNTHTDKDVQQLCAAVLESVDGFVGDAPQFDDITMLALQYNGIAE